MDKGIYTALSGAMAKANELDIVANNLANANTTGFKRDAGTFNEYLTELRKTDSPEGLGRELTAATMFEGRPAGDKSFVEMDGIYTDFRQGPITHTQRDLDIAIEGGGFIEVYTPNGVRYTRQGNLNVAPDGRLVTVNGFPVLSRIRELPVKGSLNTLNPFKGKPKPAAETMAPDGTPLTQNFGPPPEQRFIRLGPIPIHFSNDGVIFQNGQRVALMSVVEFHEPQWLEKVGNSYFRNDHPDNVITETFNSKIHQGYVESSNVNPVREMTKLIEVSRAYESHMQAIKTYQEIDGRTASEIVGGR